MMPLLLAAAGKSGLKCFLGALHPGIVHFPIALLSVAALLEILQMLRKKQEPAAGTTTMTWLAAAAAVPATLFGFMLADAEGSEGALIDRHQWLGVASTVVAILAALAALKAKSSPGALKVLRVALILGAGLVMATGYIGGELVFGENHLFKCFAEEKKAPEPPAAPDKKVMLKPIEPGGDKVDFAKDIAPVIKDMCFKCHGGEKVKGKFNLGTKKTGLGEAESGRAILPGKPTLSKFYTSLVAEKDSDDLMPPIKEKARPSKEQIEKVRLWIEQGAEWPDGVEFKK